MFCSHRVFGRRFAATGFGGRRRHESGGNVDKGREGETDGRRERTHRESERTREDDQRGRGGKHVCMIKNERRGGFVVVVHEARV